MISWAVPLIPLLLLVGCGSKVTETEVTQLPEVNIDNCLPDKVAALRTQDQREQMSSLCLRSASFTESETRQW